MEIILVLLLIATGIGLECNPALCPDSWKGDLYCDHYCMTTFCNYDSLYSPDEPWNKKQSDCYYDCITDRGCAEEKLGDGVCDPNCNYAECGYDRGDCGYCASDCYSSDLDGTTCVSACNVPECLYGLSACTECSEGCTGAMLLNNECDAACNNASCNYDDGNCSMESCATGCYDYMLDNGECNEECFNTECDYDGEDCLCSAGCLDSYLGDGYCDPECDTEACNFDDGDCGDCASGCFWEMIGDATCQIECHTENCSWDNFECGCSNDCLWDDLGSCNIGCLVLNCYYDQYPGYPECTDHTLTSFALYTHLATQDFSSEISYEHCEGVSGCPAEDFFSTNSGCDDSCDVPECAYALGHCYAGECAEGCDLCFGSGDDECFECATGVLFYTTCVDSCPLGFYAHELTGFNHPVCLPVEDTSTRDNPTQLYVQLRDDGLTGTGTLEDPFYSLTVALASIYTSYTEVILVGEGPFELRKLPEDSEYTIALQDVYNPLSRADLELQTLGISPLSGTSTLSVVSSSDYMIFEVEGVMKLSNIIFDGSKLDSDCEGDEYCSYCANISEDNGVYTTDRDETIEWGEFLDDCSAYNSISLFEVLAGGTLSMTAVTFQNLRMELSSVIKSNGGNVNLTSVDFNNIRVAADASTAVIVFEDCNDGYNCGQFSYFGGTVSLLNNGYEYSTALDFRGFFRSESTYSLDIDSVFFEYNVLYTSSSVKVALFYLEKFYYLSVTNCEFTSNYVTDGLFYIEASNMEFEYSINELEEIEQLLIDHIYFNSNTLTNNYGVNSLLLHAQYNKELQKIKVDDITLISNVVKAGPVVQVTNSIMKDEYKATSTSPVEIDGERITATFAPRTVVFSNWQVSENSFASNGLWSLDKLANLEIDQVFVHANRPETDAFNTLFLPSFTADGYLSESVEAEAAYDCLNLAYLNECYGFVLSDSEVSSNECLAWAPAFTLLSHEVFAVTNSSFVENIGHSTQPVNFYLHGNATFLFEDCTFTGNENSDGPAAIMDIGSFGLVLNDTTISDNSGSSTVYAMSDILELNNCWVESNQNPTTAGGVIYYNVPQSGSPTIKVTNTTFLDNRASASSGGVLYIADVISGGPLLTLKVSSSNFTSNYAYLYGSVLYIDSLTQLNSASYIEYTQFIDNVVTGKGALSFYHSAGTLLMSYLNVTGNSIDNDDGEGAFIYSQAGSAASLVLSDSIVASNSGKSIIKLDDTSIFNSIETESCVFVLNTGNVMVLNYASWTDYNSQFQNNSAQLGGAFLSENLAYISLTNSTFISNRATAGGAGILRSASHLVGADCKFRLNEAEFMGGALYLEQDSTIEFTESDFSENFAEKGSVVALLGCEQSSSSISTSTLTRNEASEEGTVYVVLSKMTLASSVVESNTAETGSPGICVVLGTCFLDDMTFQAQSGSIGTFVYLAATSEATITNSRFLSGESTGSGGAIYAISSVVTLSDSLFANLTAAVGGALLIYSDSVASVTSCHFENSTASVSGGVIESYESEITLYSSSFDNIPVSIMNLDKLSTLDVTNCNFTNSVAPAVSCSRCETVNIADSNFVDLTGTSAGAIKLWTEGEVGTENIQTITASTFTDNSAGTGGAIYIENISVHVSECEFISNSAVTSAYDEGVTSIEDGKGGAIYVACPLGGCLFEISENEFTGNQANYNGGAICWEDVMPTFTNNHFVNNSADYGDDTSSFPIKIMQVNDDGTLIEYRRRLQDEVEAGLLTEVASGQSTTLAVALVDHYGQIVTTNNVASSSITGNGEVGVSGVTKVTASRGIANFTDFTVSYNPGSTVSISVDSDGVVDTGTAEDNVDYYSTVSIAVELRECVIGEATVGMECIRCESGTYSLDTSDTECLTCPSEAVCYGGADMVPRSGYWRSHQYSAIFWECPNPTACVGGEMDSSGEFSYMGLCEDGYTGNMCQSCETGHSRTSTNQCGTCPELGLNVLRLLGIGIVVFVIIIVMVRTTINSAYKPKALHSVYIKIFVNYLQLVMLTASFNLEWPELVREFFSIHETAGSITDQAFSFDCFLESETGSLEDVYFSKLVIMSVVPLMLALGAVLVWCCICLCKRTWKYMKEEFVATLVILLFLVHPTLIKLMFSAMNCTEIEDGEYWLATELDIQCWSSTHVSYILLVAIPSIAVWGVGAPALCLFILSRYRKRLNRLSVRKKFGFLFNGYTSRGYYWEFVILYRKILIICCSVFFANISIPVQALTVMLLLVLSLYMQIVHQPYTEVRLNQMEVRSILVSTVTIYCGLYYLTGDLDETGKLFFFIVIIGINAYFLYVWGASMFGAGVELVGKKIGCIRRLCIRKVQDGYDDEVFRVEERQPHVQGKANEKSYTLLGRLGQASHKATDVYIHPDTTMNDLFIKTLRRDHHFRGIHGNTDQSLSLLVSDTTRPAISRR